MHGFSKWSYLVTGKSFPHERLLMDVIDKIEREAHTTGLTDQN